MHKSVWFDDVRLPAFGKLEEDLNTDVLIVGGGMAGLLCAWRLRQEGVDCALIEAGRICRGITGNTTAKITSQHGFVYHKLLRRFGGEKARMYYEANERALNEYRSLSRQYPCDLEIKRNGIYVREDLQMLEQEWDALGKLHIPAMHTQEVPVPVENRGGIYFPDQAQFHPVKLISGLAKKLRIYEQTPAREFGPNWVKTDGGTIRAKKMILATHFPIMNKHGGFFLKLYQERSYVIALEGGPDVKGMYLDSKTDGLSFRNYKDLLLLGGGSYRTGKKNPGWKELEDFARRQYPQAKLRCHWAAQDCISLDGVPYIGRYSAAIPDVYVATGFNKWGMSSSMVASLILTDLVQDRPNPWAELYDPARSILHKQLFVNGVESTLNLLKPTKPRCPHLGCALKWNPQEHSWDCPCHGSRFREDGRLLDNPATADGKHMKNPGS